MCGRTIALNAAGNGASRLQCRKRADNHAILSCISMLDAVKKLLATTDRPIKVISEACGYTDLAYLKTLFKRRFGCTMRDWRRQNHA